jgi:hypothetical protein
MAALGLCSRKDAKLTIGASLQKQTIEALPLFAGTWGFAAQHRGGQMTIRRSTHRPSTTCRAALPVLEGPSR